MAIAIPRGAFFSLLIVIAAATGCGEGAIPACADGGTTATYDNFGLGFLEANCNWCHGAGVQDRHGAPAEITFDTLEQVLARKDRIYARATGDRPSMPPGPDKPSAADRARLAAWLACAPP